MFRQYRPIQKKEFIVVGVDTAAGGGDYSAAQFISKTNFDVPLVYHSKTTTFELTNSLYPILEKIFDQTGVKPVVAYERQNGGFFEMERLNALNRYDKFKIFKMPAFGRGGESEKLGWDTNSATRPLMLSSLKDAIDKRILRIYDKNTVDELFSFVNVYSSTSVKAKAAPGARDDLVMALAIAYQIFIHEEIPQTKEDIENYIEELPKEDYFKDGFY